MPGSGVWWIRCRDADGKVHRELAARKSDAESLPLKRQNELRPRRVKLEDRVIEFRSESLLSIFCRKGEHLHSLDREPVPNPYLPEADGADTSMTIMLRTVGDPSQLDEALRRTVRSDQRT